MGNYFTTKVQLGQQSAYGTPQTTATIIPTGLTGVWEDKTELVNVAADMPQGTKIDKLDLATKSVLADLALDGYATHENLTYIGNGLKAGTTGSTYLTSGKSYTFTPVVGASDAPTLFTAQVGDETQAWQIQDLLLMEASIKAAWGGDKTEVSSKWTGHTLATTSFTSSVPYLAATKVPASTWKLYIEDGGGTFGTNAKTALMRDFELKITTGYMHDGYLQGNSGVAPDSYNQGKLKIELGVTYDINATSLTEWGKYGSKGIRKIRLDNTGATIGAGTAKYLTRFDMVGLYMPFGKPTEKNGKSTFAGTLTVGYDITDTTPFSMFLANTLATLT